MIRPITGISGELFCYLGKLELRSIVHLGKMPAIKKVYILIQIDTELLQNFRQNLFIVKFVCLAHKNIWKNENHDKTAREINFLLMRVELAVHWRKWNQLCYCMSNCSAVDCSSLLGNLELNMRPVL